MRISILCLSCLPLLASAVEAQRGIGTLHTGNLLGDDRLPPGTMNLSDAILTATGSSQPVFSGVVRLPNGNYIVSASKRSSSTAHKFFEIAADGTLVNSSDQPNGTNADNLGLSDLAWDRETTVNSRIWAGFAGKGINSFDWQTFAFDPSFNPANLQTGLKIMDGWRGSFVQCSAIADVDGQKIFVSADIFNPNPLVNPPTFGTPVNYHTLGSLTPDIFKFKEPTPDISDPDVTILGADNSGKWGAAYDPLRSTIWWHVDLPTASANANGSRTRFIEMDLNGDRTGQIFQGDRGVGGLAWGCEMYVDGNGELITVYLIGGAQGAPAGDAVLVEIKSRFQFGSSCGGDISYAGEPFIGSDAWMIHLDNAPVNAFGPAILARGIADLGAGTLIPGINNCPLMLTLVGFRDMGSHLQVNGSASFLQVIPQITSLVGIEISYQWLLPGPQVLPFNLSDAGAARIGSDM